jgi:hypothetical protein
MGRAFVVWCWRYGRKWREACSPAACDIQTGAACFRFLRQVHLYHGPPQSMSSIFNICAIYIYTHIYIDTYTHVVTYAPTYMHTYDKCDLDDEHQTACQWRPRWHNAGYGPGHAAKNRGANFARAARGGRVGLEKWDVLLLFWEMLGKSWNISLVNLVSSILFELETYGFPYNVPMEAWLVDVIRFYDGFQMGADRPAVFLPFSTNLAGLPQKQRFCATYPNVSRCRTHLRGRAPPARCHHPSFWGWRVVLNKYSKVMFQAEIWAGQKGRDTGIYTNAILMRKTTINHWNLLDFGVRSDTAIIQERPAGHFVQVMVHIVPLHTPGRRPGFSDLDGVMGSWYQPVYLPQKIPITVEFLFFLHG